MDFGGESCGEDAKGVAFDQLSEYESGCFSVVFSGVHCCVLEALEEGRYDGFKCSNDYVSYVVEWSIWGLSR